MGGKKGSADDFHEWVLLFLVLFSGERKGINQNLAASVSKSDLLLDLWFAACVTFGRMRRV